MELFKIDSKLHVFKIETCVYCLCFFQFESILVQLSVISCSCSNRFDVDFVQLSS